MAPDTRMTGTTQRMAVSPFVSVPLTIALVYMLAGFLWVLFSDLLVSKIAPDEATYQTMQTFKGWFFVVVTGAVLFVVLKMVYRHILVAYHRAAQSEERLELALTCAKGGIWDRDLTREDGLYISPRIKALVGIPANQTVRLEEWRERIHPLDAPGLRASVENVIAARGKLAHEVRYRLKGSDGRYLRIHSLGTVLCDENGEPNRLVGVILDETAQMHAAERISQLMAYDSLTGLANRNTFITQLDQMLKLAQHGEVNIAVAQVLIHDFNELFDEYGNEFTNKIIQAVGAKLSEAIEPDKLICRLEHNCFGLAGPYRQDVEGVHQSVRFITSFLEQPIEVEGLEIQLSYSIGAAISPQDGNSANMLIANSHRALSKYDREGRDSIHWFTEGMDVEIRQRLQRLRDLRNAVESHEIDCHYQPIVDLRTGKTIGFEALARWHRPGEGMVPPDQFIEIAEESGYIHALGEQILRNACEQAVQWKCSNGNAPFVAVNVSARQLDDPNFPAIVCEVLREYGLSPDRLELEVTEAAMAHDVEDARTRLEALRELGVSLALDDFGTGYSCLSNLSHLPFTRLKLDRSFTREYGRNVRSTEIANAVLVLSRALGLHVTVEGVETLLQSSCLRAVGVEAVQGFYFSRAVPAKDVWKLLEQDWAPFIEDDPVEDELLRGLRA